MFSFKNCTSIKNVELLTNEKLQIIENYAFAKSLSQIQSGAFNACKKLKKVEIPKNFELKEID